MSDLDSLVEAIPHEPSPVEKYDIESLVSEFRDIRDALSIKRKEYTEYETAAKDRMDQITMILREVADYLGLNALPTKSGTAYRTIKKNYRVGSWDSILNFIKETGNWQMLEKRIGKLATQEIHDLTGEIPPGVDFSQEVEFVVRKN